MKWHARSAAWLTTGRLEGGVRGLGMPAGVKDGEAVPAGGRGVIVPMKPAKADGGKGAREEER